MTACRSFLKSCARRTIRSGISRRKKSIHSGISDTAFGKQNFRGRHTPPFFIGQAMNITVKLFASFRTGRFGEQQRCCSEGCTAGRLLAELGIAEAEVGVMLANGKHITSAEALSDGDSSRLFPLLGGG